MPGPRQFQRQRPGQAEDAMLGGAIGADIGIALEGGGRGDGDQPAPAASSIAGERGLPQVEDAGQVDVEHLLRDRSPPSSANGLLIGRAGIGNDDVGGSPCASAALRQHRATESGSVTSPAPQAMPAWRFAVSCKRGLAAAGDGHLRARFGQCQRDRGADAAAAAGHEGVSCPQVPPSLTPSPSSSRRARPDATSGRGRGDRGRASFSSWSPSALAACSVQ